MLLLLQPVRVVVVVVPPPKQEKYRLSIHRKQWPCPGQADLSQCPATKLFARSLAVYANSQATTSSCLTLAFFRLFLSSSGLFVVVPSVVPNGGLLQFPLALPYLREHLTTEE